MNEGRPSPRKAELLRYTAADGAPLGALLWRPDAAADSAIVMIPGFNGNIVGGLHDYQPLAEAATARGHAFLLPCLRTAGDFSDARFEDCEADIAAALGAIKARGISEIALFGTSLGGPRAVYYLARTGDSAVRALGFLASIMSPYEEAQLRMPEEDRARLEALLRRCRELVAAGEAEECVTFRDWFPRRHVRATARGFLSIFGAPGDTACGSHRYGPQVRVPSLVVHGTADEIAFPPNAQAIHDSLTAAPGRELVWVEGARHWLEPGWIAERYAEVIAAGVARTMPAAGGRR